MHQARHPLLDRQQVVQGRRVENTRRYYEAGRRRPPSVRVFYTLIFVLVINGKTKFLSLFLLVGPDPELYMPFYLF
jgi:hypothetical protein